MNATLDIQKKNDPLEPSNYCFTATEFLEKELSGTPYKDLGENIRHKNDVVSFRMPEDYTRNVVLDNCLSAKFYIKDTDLDDGYLQIRDWYVLPAIKDLAEAILERNKGFLAFAALPHCGADLQNMGVRSHTFYNHGLSARTRLQYNSARQATEVRIEVLFGTYDPESDEGVKAPVRPAIEIEEL